MEPFNPSDIPDFPNPEKMVCDKARAACENNVPCDNVTSEQCSDTKKSLQSCGISKCPMYDKCCKSNMGIIILITVLSLIVVGVFVFMILKHKRKFVLNK